MIKNNGCTLCPRECNADRKNKLGFCKATEKMCIAKTMLHKWEEPGICYGNGSGAVFFSGCQMHCVFCQNHSISQKAVGKELSPEMLSHIFIELQNKGACNINLVSPTPYTNDIITALKKAKKEGLSIPIVFNSGGFEKKETLELYSGLIDIYLPDFKFFSPSVSKRYAFAESYSLFCKESLLEMYRQVGPPVWEDGHLKKGLLIRHMILPGNTADSIEVLKCIREIFSPEEILLSLLRQYTPMPISENYPEISRPITSLEYQKVLRAAKDLGFENLYTQQKESVSTSFVPDFTIFSSETD